MQVKRFIADPNDMEPQDGLYCDDEIRYDYDRADRDVLEKFEDWKSRNKDAQVISITGPVREFTVGRPWVVLVVLFEPAMVAA
jgi:hypothetical protein